ncbi:MAG: hypothetical protein JWL59_1325 [Chthoniobacteraceae bacterium]|nr:hypothetical protein [Chthoniobacteraceae bacterium]
MGAAGELSGCQGALGGSAEGSRRRRLYLMFEAVAMLPVLAAGAIVNRHYTQLWRMLKHYVKEASKESFCLKDRKLTGFSAKPF